MKLSVFYEHILIAATEMGMPVADLCASLHANGIDAFEVDARTVTDVDAFRASCEKNGMQPSLYCFFDFPAAYDRNLVKNCLNAAIGLHTDHVLCVPGMVQPHEKLRWQHMLRSLVRFCNICADNGISVQVENFDALNAPTQTMAELDELFAVVPNLYFCLDTGNFLTGELDAPAAAERYFKKIRRVHLKDRAVTDQYSKSYAVTSDGTPRYCCPVGSGIIPIAKTVRALHARGYDGTYVIEHFNLNHMAEGLAASCRYLSALEI